MGREVGRGGARGGAARPTGGEMADMWPGLLGLLLHRHPDELAAHNALLRPAHPAQRAAPSLLRRRRRRRPFFLRVRLTSDCCRPPWPPWPPWLEGTWGAGPLFFSARSASSPVAAAPGRDDGPLSAATAVVVRGQPAVVHSLGSSCRWRGLGGSTSASTVGPDDALDLLAEARPVSLAEDVARVRRADTDDA